MVEANFVVLAAGAWSSLWVAWACKLTPLSLRVAKSLSWRSPRQILRGVVDGRGASVRPVTTGECSWAQLSSSLAFASGPPRRRFTIFLLAHFVSFQPWLRPCFAGRGQASDPPRVTSYPLSVTPRRGDSSSRPLTFGTECFFRRSPPEIVESIVRGVDPPVDIAPFSPRRLSP